MKSLKSIIVPIIGFYFIRALGTTLKWEFRDYSKIDWRDTEPKILACWHGDLLMIPLSLPQIVSNLDYRAFTVIASQHGDGRIVADILTKFGFRNVAGSSSSNGSNAVLGLMKAMRQGSHIALTPDGPKGPKREAKQGAAFLASKTGSPILPVVIAANQFWKLKTWDNLFIPKPRAKIIALMGEAIKVPPLQDRENIEKYTQLLTVKLNELKREAESIVCQDES